MIKICVDFALNFFSLHPDIASLFVVRLKRGDVDQGARLFNALLASRGH